MFIGDQEITREQMPAMQAWQANPDHLRQSIQDILDVKLNQGLIPPQGVSAPQQGTMDSRNQQWQ